MDNVVWVCPTTWLVWRALTSTIAVGSSDYAPLTVFMAAEHDRPERGTTRLPSTEEEAFTSGS